MTAHILLIIFLVGLWYSLCTRNLIVRCLSLKVSIDSLGIFVLGFTGRFDKGDLRLTTILIMSLGALWIVLLILGHRYFISKKEREAS